MPLFARAGFAGTTTRELAEAAGISEALLFRHFPSKQSLYREILRLGCEGDPALEKIASLQPSTETLVGMVRFMVRHFVKGCGSEHDELLTRLRLILHSFLEDGEYARELFETMCGRVSPLFEASLAAAIASGEAAPSGGAAANVFWFSQHVAIMIAFAALPGDSSVPYQGSLDEIVETASTFILRGLGMSDTAIAAATRNPQSSLDRPASPDGLASSKSAAD
ncbi:MAG: helix-turn-helix transcriptional regulator [Alphaproteobacteria bacterium]|nr:helix-turn-helix transcriptional regulator [Alphaproteobacteria bacterium]